jgi:hypothetical protein
MGLYCTVQYYNKLLIGETESILFTAMGPCTGSNLDACASAMLPSEAMPTNRRVSRKLYHVYLRVDGTKLLMNCGIQEKLYCERTDSDQGGYPRYNTGISLVYLRATSHKLMTFDHLQCRCVQCQASIRLCLVALHLLTRAHVCIQRQRATGITVWVSGCQGVRVSGMRGRRHELRDGPVPNEEGQPSPG